jgi:DNA-binding response OmpR family regulator
MRILVVEDQALTALAVILELERAGYETCGPAYTSQEALALAQAHRPNIALVDITLEAPLVGLELAERFTSELGIGVIYMTSQIELARSHAHCAIGLIAKPFELGEVPDSVAMAERLMHSETRAGLKVPRGLELFEHAQATEKPSSLATRTGRGSALESSELAS